MDAFLQETGSQKQTQQKPLAAICSVFQAFLTEMRLSTEHESMWEYWATLQPVVDLTSILSKVSDWKIYKT